MTFGRRAALAVALAAALVVAACGGADDDSIGGVGSDQGGFAGYRRDPAPEVGDLALPDLTDGGADFALRAEPGHLLIVYFGYTNCPDFCPTTLSDLRLAIRRLDESDGSRIDVAMVTVDPERDLPVLPGYVTSFFEDGHALGTDDVNLLAQALAPFGASYELTRDDAGEVVDVAHTTSLYAVDDSGELVLTWQFGVAIDDLAADLGSLLDEQDAAA